MQNWTQNVQESVDGWCELVGVCDIHHRMCLKCVANVINLLETHCFAHISFMTTPIVAAELFLKYCLFWNTWFSLLSGTYHNLCCYLDRLYCN
jgi:hypothetical protein